MTDRSAKWTLSDDEDELANSNDEDPSPKQIADRGLDQESDSSDYDEDISSNSKKRVRFDLHHQDQTSLFSYC